LVCVCWCTCVRLKGRLIDLHKLICHESNKSIRLNKSGFTYAEMSVCLCLAAFLITKSISSSNSAVQSLKYSVSQSYAQTIVDYIYTANKDGVSVTSTPSTSTAVLINNYIPYSYKLTSVNNSVYYSLAKADSWGSAYSVCFNGTYLYVISNGPNRKLEADLSLIKSSNTVSNYGDDIIYKCNLAIPGRVLTTINDIYVFST
jgi:hypothetical protein